MIKNIVFFVPNIDDGGIEKNLVILCNFFILKGYAVEVIFFRISNNIKKKINKKVKLIKCKNLFSFTFVNQRINNSINCFFYSVFSIKIDKKSVIFSMQDHPFAIIISLIKGIPSILRIANHPIGSLKFFNNYFIFKIKLFVKILFYHFADIIICNSKQSSNFIRKSLYIKKKVFYIYNPIKKIGYLYKNFKRNKYELLTVGRLENQKNLTGMLWAISILKKKYKRIKLTIVGKGSQKDHLISLSKELKIQNNIIFEGYSKPDFYYKKKGMFILNSFFEGLPNVLVEAMQYKIPIISTNCLSGPEEILENGKYGSLVNVKDYKDLAKKIENNINDYNSALTKASKGHASLTRFSADKQCQKYLDIIRIL